MRVLRGFPSIAPALRDGRLCLSTVTLLGPLFTTENVEELVARAAYKTKAEVEQLVASLRPTEAPSPGIRLLPSGRCNEAASGALQLVSVPADAGESRVEMSASSLPPLPGGFPASAVDRNPPAPVARVEIARDCVGSTTTAGAAPAREITRPPSELRPVSEREWSLRVTLDAALKADLETLTNLLAHQARGNLTAILREAVRCAIEKHGKRKGAVPPARLRRSAALGRAAAPRDCDGAPGIDATGAEPTEARPSKRPAQPPPAQVKASAAPPNARTIPVAVRRAVWERDGGACTFTSDDGRRCGSAWMLELDHIQPVALGGASTIDNLRVRCRGHNVLYAEGWFGREHMERCERRVARHARLKGGAATRALIPG
jgi:hypothetical protein